MKLAGREVRPANAPTGRHMRKLPLPNRFGSRLDGSQRHGESIRLKRVLGQIARGATVSDHQRCLTVKRIPRDGVRCNAAQRQGDGGGK